MKNKYLGFGTVTWADALELTFDKEEFDRIIADSDGFSLLAMKETYGQIYKLENVVIIVMEYCFDGSRECTIVPDAWVLDIKINGRTKRS
jgi:hypothetical protein